MSAAAKARSKSSGRFQGCSLAQNRTIFSSLSSPQEARTAARFTLAASPRHQSLSTVSRVMAIFRSGILSERIISEPALDAVSTWLNIRNNTGQANFLTQIFHFLPSRASIEDASVKNINGVVLVRAPK